MSYLRSIWRRVGPAATVVGCWLALHGTALAGEAEQKSSKGGASSWVSSYGLVLLGIVLGMLGVCLTSRRREREKPETYDKTRLVQEKKS
jgi:hypothetical protein